MKVSRFVRPETRVLKLPDRHDADGTVIPGETLTVRKRLNHGERTAAFTRMYQQAADGSRRVDPTKVGMATIVAYLLDWTLTDDDGNVVAIRDQPVEVLESALNALDPDSFDEIRRAIDQHEADMAAERAAGKPKDGATTSPGISPSPEGAAGDTPTSSS